MKKLKVILLFISLVYLNSCCKFATSICPDCINPTSPEGKAALVAWYNKDKAGYDILAELDNYKDNSPTIQKELRRVNKTAILHLELVDNDKKSK